jgi:hypothetical protein
VKETSAIEEYWKLTPELSGKLIRLEAAQTILQCNIFQCNMEFVEEPKFTKAIQRFPDSDYAAFQEDLAAHPEQGDLVRGTGGFRKARMGFPSAGIGKSGGARVIYLHAPEQETIYLVMIYGKSQKKDLTREEENALRKAADQIRNSRRAR